MFVNEASSFKPNVTTFRPQNLEANIIGNSKLRSTEECCGCDAQCAGWHAGTDISLWETEHPSSSTREWGRVRLKELFCRTSSIVSSCIGNVVANKRFRNGCGVQVWVHRRRSTPNKHGERMIRCSSPYDYERGGIRSDLVIFKTNRDKFIAALWLLDEICIAWGHKFLKRIQHGCI